ncbi:glycosyl hydrolase family 17 protein [Seonamhaeicola aphaedonensis]|uniref:Endo-1,3-beta-glucanase btgC n=1 Tax=Seonamhaeicola aphaedonensis TaxID=1461338 RepID=A0A3D9HHS7_9FLAO|nr:glycosyl hydrolase family 17 protein [Seonamhaeicola aphaedonensis]RED48994.1 exo-beta-1,3-glucanase (GH17 family) [Seonamhaeicola aphaedonensis]
MKHLLKITQVLILSIIMMGCKNEPKKENKTLYKQQNMTAANILGNPEYLAISYGGYRTTSRDDQPTIAQLKEDMKILQAMGVKILRTYNVQLPHASNVLRAIRELKQEDADFEMYVMLGAWIDCKNAWTELEPDHNIESEKNVEEIDRVVLLANQYPDIVKILAVGNEAMVHWATSYYVQPSVILKWVNHLQDLKANDKLPKDLWITSSDDFASWGGGDQSYHTEDLNKLIKAVDYISMHTYPMHNTHYNPAFWLVPEDEINLSDDKKIESAMQRSLEFAKKQYDSVTNYMKSLGVNKPIHIGETGWATVSNGHYGETRSRAVDEYKSGRYYKLMREWTNKENISCFYFEAFDEQWKDAKNPKGSENHFGLINLKGEAKYAVWNLVDQGAFKGLTRDGQTIKKTFNGNINILKETVLAPPVTYELQTH